MVALLSLILGPGSRVLGTASARYTQQTNLLMALDWWARFLLLDVQSISLLGGAQVPQRRRRPFGRLRLLLVRHVDLELWSIIPQERHE